MRSKGQRRKYKEKMESARDSLNRGHERKELLE
jgi:hypothetical protein